MFKRQDYSAVFFVFFFTSLPFLNIIVIIIIIILFLLVVRRSENTRCGKDTHTHKKKTFRDFGLLWWERDSRHLIAAAGHAWSNS